MAPPQAMPSSYQVADLTSFKNTTIGFALPMSRTSFSV